MSGDPQQVQTLLDAAATALDHGRHLELAERLREAWRATRNAELADAYELLLRDFQAPPLAGRNPSERAASWIERATSNPGDPLELPVLLAELGLDAVDRDERLRLLAAWSPDPALASALARDLRMSSPEHGVEPYWPEQLALLDAQADPRQAPTLERMLAQLVAPAEFRRQLRRVHAKLERIRPVDPGPSAARITRRADRRRELERRSAELLAAVHAAPDADEPRLVYADWLASHGDPRGEFISLQVERARSGAPVSERERVLLERHAKQWSGALERLLGERSFERGFLAAGSIEVAKLDGELAELGDWSTFRTLDGHVSDALVFRGPLDHLRELYGYRQLDRFVAARAANRLGAVESYECDLRDRNVLLDTPLWLRSLLVRNALDDTLLELIDAPAISDLERLGVYYSSLPSYAHDHRERLDIRHRVELLRERLPSHVRELFLIDDHTARASLPLGWRLSFRRDELDRFAELRLDWFGPSANLVGDAAAGQMLAILGELRLELPPRIVLGEFDDPARELALALLTELSRVSGAQLEDRG